MSLMSGIRRWVGGWMVAGACLCNGLFGQTFLSQESELLDWEQSGNLETERGYLRLHCPNVKGRQEMNILHKRFSGKQLSGQVLHFECEVKGKDILKGKKPWETLKMLFTCHEKGGKTHYSDASVLTGTFDWRRIEKDVPLPENLESVVFSIGFQGTSGTAWFRDMSLRVAGRPLSIVPVANMGYADQVAGDGKGGWTDQGPGNDGRAFASGMKGRRTLGGIAFQPALTGKSVLTMYSSHFPQGPKAVTLPVQRGISGRYLLILHAGSWMQGGVYEMGRLVVTGRGGHRQVIPVRANEDVGDWWHLRGVPNGGPCVQVHRGDGGMIGLYASRFMLDQGVGEISSIRFEAGDGRSTWTVVGLAVSDSELPLPKPRPNIIREGEQWRPVTAVSGLRESGSVLDLSSYYPHVKAGDHGRVIINASGQLAFATAPDRPVRFYTNGISGAIMDECGDKAGIKRFCAEMRKAGFNMVRTHFLDAWLCKDAPTERGFNPKHLDLFDYLIYEMKEHGIYLNFDCMTNFLGYTHGRNAWLYRTSPECYKGQIYFNPKVWENWCWGVREVLTHVNPYTKTRLIDEPLLALTHGYNEQEFGFRRSMLEEQVLPAYRSFLKSRYQTIEAFNRTFGKRYGSFEEIPCFIPGKFDDLYVQQFMLDQEVGILKRYRAFLDELGYKGLLSNFNMMKTQHYNNVRRYGDYVSINTYHDHPYGPNLTLISQQSGLRHGFGHYRDAISTRQYGKPFVMTEYASVFWNKYRYEHSFGMCAFAALQGFDGITSHAYSVSVRNLHDSPLRMSPFRIHNDPVRLAAEYLGFFMYLRGDVKAADRRVRLAVDMDRIYDDKLALKTVGAAQNQLALLMGFGLDCKTGKHELKPLTDKEIRLTLKEGANSVTTMGASQTVEKATNSAQVVRILKQNGFLPKGNRTDGVSIFESVTGELYLDLARNFMMIDTPRLQGFCLEAGDKGKAQAGDFGVLSLSERGCVSVVSVDGLKPLRESRRMTVVYATDALNSGMSFADPNGQAVTSFGRVPVLLKTGRFTARLRNRHASSLRLYALDLTGHRTKEILDKRAEGDVLTFTVDTRRDGATVFFELVAD